MKKVLHPRMAKRVAQSIPNSHHPAPYDGRGTYLNHHWRSRDANAQKKAAKGLYIPDNYWNVATIKIIATNRIDYSHIAKSGAKWVIVNVLWEMK